MQPPKSYSAGGQRSSWAAYRQARRRPARLQGSLVRGLHAPSGAHESYTLKICMQYQDEKDSTMTILDVSMLSGFAADVEDLKRLTNQVDQYIQNYVIERELTNGSLIIHLYRVPHKSPECISFNIHQMFKVGMLQPAAITIYEYYSPVNRCTKFYHPDKNPAVLSQICKGEVCKCVEETCSSLIKLNKLITASDRQKEACKPGVDYVYKVRVEEIDLSKGYDEYTMEIVEVIKQGTDVFHDDRKRTYSAHSSCRQPLDLRKGREYLIMGNSRDLWSIKEKLTYIIGGTTWVEWWPTKEESQTEDSRSVYLGINDFVSELMEYGCSN